MEQILAKLGNFGRYQAFLYALVFLPGMIAGLLAVTFSWTGYIPNVRCKLPFEGSNANYSWPFDSNQTRFWYPRSDDNSGDGDEALCKYCPRNDTYSTSSENCGEQVSAIKCDNGFVYDTSVFRTSLIVTVGCFY